MKIGKLYIFTEQQLKDKMGEQFDVGFNQGYKQECNQETGLRKEQIIESKKEKEC